MKLEFQPIVDIETGAVERVEALVGRLARADGDDVADSPASARKRRRARTEAVITTVLGERAMWPEPVAVSIEISPSQLFEADAPEHVASLVAEFDADLSVVTFELADGVQDTLTANDCDAMHRLAMCGIRFCLSGFSPTSAAAASDRMLRLPLREVKIDARRLVDREPNNARAIERALALARAKHIDVVATSVDSQHLVGLRDVGCSYAQGDAFGSPMTQADVSARLARRDFVHAT
ncbi:MAG: hypothetical protein NVS4B5_10010 [Vulcanimicrobiaceae bacterium]